MKLQERASFLFIIFNWHLIQILIIFLGKNKNNIFEKNWVILMSMDKLNRENVRDKFNASQAL